MDEIKDRSLQGQTVGAIVFDGLSGCLPPRISLGKFLSKQILWSRLSTP
ncbi:MAG: hypothetical protein MR000_12370 [Cloacibacillus porcorum]|nr:hypothetical protein [Cloacibacillus porcorum]MCI5866010.1 hypothetical protein [Cloacibacillus porcorum]